MTVRDLLAHDVDRPPGAFGRDPEVDDERVERPEPEIVRAPPRDLIEQAGIDAGSDQAAARSV